MRADSKLARRKWQHTRQTQLNIETVQNGQILRAGSKLIDAGDYTPKKQGGLFGILQRE